jgi:hypothetical protein
MRIFVLGDSFADNLFKESYEYIYSLTNQALINQSTHFSSIQKYLISLQNENIENAKWWTDWLEEWGYEIINLGKGGCSNQNIFYQFAKIDKEFKEGDRIILHWTDYCRFDWVANERGRVISVHPAMNGFEEPLKTILHTQSVYIDESFTTKGAHLNDNLVPFMNWIVEKHSEYNPIIWSVFGTVKYLDKSRYFHMFSPYFLSLLNNKWEILKETNFLINDGHFGRYGNYYSAVVFDEIIKSGITINLNEQSNKLHIIENSLKRIKNENLIFKNPISWGNHL